MNLNWIRERFIDSSARKPMGKWAVKNYNTPKAHYYSFKVIMEELNLTDDDIYCEVGCGGGFLLNMAMSSAKKGAAIDHSPDMVQLSTRNNQQSVDAGTLEIICGSAEKLPWESGTFTACASANMFFFVEKPEAMLSEIVRVLKPGGRFVMVTASTGLLVKIMFGLLYKLKTYSNPKMRSMLEAAGFNNISVKTIKFGTMQICYGEKT